MKRSELEARLRQLFAIDKNALDIYEFLLNRVDDEQIKKGLQTLIRDENKHVKMEEAILRIVSP